MAGAEDGRPLGLAQARRMGALLPSIPEEYGGLGASFAYDAAIYEDMESDRAGRVERRHRVERHRRALHQELRLRGAEAALAAEHGARRTDRRHRDDRARHRLRPAGGAHHRQAAGQRLRHQRPEDLHHQRPERRSGHRRRAHRRTRRQGAVADRAGDQGQSRLQARPQPRQDRPARLRHLGAVLRGRHRAAGKPARRRGGQGLRATDAAIAAGAADHRDRRGGGDGARGAS